MKQLFPFWKQFNKKVMGMSELPKGWVETTLGEVATISSSKRIFHSDYVNSGIPFYRSKEVIEKQKGNNISTELFITKEKFNEIKSKFGAPEKDDLLLTSVGTLGVPYLVKINEIFYFKDGKLTWFRKYNGLAPNYIYHFFLSSIGKERLNEITIGSTQSALTISGLKNININLPPLDEQKSIADILSSFDDKIELLREQNKTLETLSQTLFKEWFVKFNFPNATGEMINSELGQIPKGWRVGRIKKFVKDSIGGDYGKDELSKEFSEKTLCIRGTDLPDMKTGLPERAPIRYLKKQKIDNCRVVSGDVIIEISGGTENQSTGRTIYINEEILSNTDLPITSVNFCRILRPVKKEYGYFIYSLFQYLYNNRTLFNWENGTTGIKNLALKALLNDFDLIVPESDKEILEFNDLVGVNFKKIQKNAAQIQTLEKTRDALLPKLMNGNIRVV